MIKTHSTNPDGSAKILLGRTMVEYFKISEDEKSETVAKQGVVIGNYGSFLRILDFRPVSKGGDSWVGGEVLPLNSKRGYIRIVSELREDDAIKIAPSF